MQPPTSRSPQPPSSYLAIAENTNDRPPSANWRLIAAAGTKGDKGGTGPVPLKPVAAWVTGHAYIVGPPADFVLTLVRPMSAWLRTRPARSRPI
jgi:hypothetical protein